MKNLNEITRKSFWAQNTSIVSQGYQLKHLPVEQNIFHTFWLNMLKINCFCDSKQEATYLKILVN